VALAALLLHLERLPSSPAKKSIFILVGPQYDYTDSHWSERKEYQLEIGQRPFWRATSGDIARKNRQFVTIQSGLLRSLKGPATVKGKVLKSLRSSVTCPILVY
jgi:hypothetical protein